MKHSDPRRELFTSAGSVGPLPRIQNVSSKGNIMRLSHLRSRVAIYASTNLDTFNPIKIKKKGREQKGVKKKGVLILLVFGNMENR